MEGMAVSKQAHGLKSGTDSVNDTLNTKSCSLNSV